MSNEILRVGFPTNDEITVEEHFGHCEKFAVYTIENGNVIKKRFLKLQNMHQEYSLDL